MVLGDPFGVTFSPQHRLELAFVSLRRRSNLACSRHANYRYVPSGAQLISERSQAPTGNVLPHVLAAVDLACELGLWPLYRLASLMLAETIAPLDNAMAVREVGRVWTQVQQSGDKEALAIGASVLGRAELEHALERDQGDFSEYKADLHCIDEAAMARSYLETALKAAEAIKLRSRQIETLGLLALLPDTPRQDADNLAEQWQALCEKKHEPADAERARKIGAVIQLVGVRIVERWS